MIKLANAFALRSLSRASRSSRLQTSSFVCVSPATTAAALSEYLVHALQLTGLDWRVVDSFAPSQEDSVSGAPSYFDANARCFARVSDCRKRVGDDDPSRRRKRLISVQCKQCIDLRWLPRYARDFACGLKRPQNGSTSTPRWFRFAQLALRSG